MLLGFNGATTLTADLATDIRAAQAAGYGCLEIWAPKLLGYFANGSLPTCAGICGGPACLSPP